MWVCIYVRVGTQSLHVVVYIFTYIHTEFTCICIYLRICTQSLHVCVHIYLRTCAQSLRVCVYTFSYIHTEFTCLCPRISVDEGVFLCVYIYLYVCGYIYVSATTIHFGVCSCLESGSARVGAV